MLYSFDNFTLDTQRYQLRRTGQPIPLEPQVFKVLTYLVQHYDRVVPRQELFERLWPGQYVSDDALGRCIRKARQAFGDRREAPRFIKTLPRHGYHFIAPVTVQTHDAHACALLTAIDDVSNEAELLQTLERLQRAEFLYETPVGSERTYMFKHASPKRSPTGVYSTSGGKRSMRGWHRC